MLADRLEDIDEALLLQVCSEGWAESATLEFKQMLPRPGPDDRQEFCKDVAAMANSGGGDIVYGISEKSGCAATIIGIDVGSLDAEKRRLAQSLEAGVEPRITGISFREVQVTAGCCLVIRVPQSFDGPHRVIKDHRFVARAGTHTMDLTYDQLRNAFGRTATLLSTAKAFVDARRAHIAEVENVDEDGALALQPICVAHLVSLASIAGRVSVDVRALHLDSSPLRFTEWGGSHAMFNLDGVLASPSGSGPRLAYTQAFRNGAFEAVRTGRSAMQEATIPSSVVSKFYREALHKFISAAVTSGAAGPAIFSISMLSVRGWTFGVSPNFDQNYRALSDRTDLRLPDIWIERIESVEDLDALIRPSLDVLWQSFGVERCLDFDVEGKWALRRY